jgi:hypothetical protein
LEYPENENVIASLACQLFAAVAEKSNSGLFANGFRGEPIEAFLLFPVFVTAVLAFYIFNNNTGIA